jgi:hypothetical protein
LAWEEEEGGQLGWLGQKAEWACWLLGQLGRKPGEIPFRNKIGFLNFQKLWKFVQGDLGGILMWGFFLNSSRIFKDFRRI